jgi:hypothetical protein
VEQFIRNDIKFVLLNASKLETATFSNILVVTDFGKFSSELPHNDLAEELHIANGLTFSIDLLDQAFIRTHSSCCWETVSQRHPDIFSSIDDIGQHCSGCGNKVFETSVPNFVVPIAAIDNIEDPNYRKYPKHIARIHNYFSRLTAAVSNPLDAVIATEIFSNFVEEMIEEAYDSIAKIVPQKNGR